MKISSTNIIAIVGPESTGKTSLAEKLSKHFNCPLVNEVARGYLTSKNGDYNSRDVELIAQEQYQLEEATFAANPTSKFVLCDTDVIVNKIWFEFKYKKSSNAINLILESQKQRKYLLLYPDLEWEFDPLRENPNDLKELFRAYEKTLLSNNFDFRTIRGKGQLRLTAAIEAINQMKIG